MTLPNKFHDSSMGSEEYTYHPCFVCCVAGGATLIFEVQLLGVNGKMYKEPEEDKEATKDL